MSTMRSAILLLSLLLPWSLFSEVKVLIPVVAKDASGQPITDLTVADLQVSGPHGIGIDDLQLIPPTTSKRDLGIQLVILYDAANSRNPYPDLREKWLLAFLDTVAKNRLPATFFINTTDGLQSIYDPATGAEVLSAALILASTSNATTDNQQVQEQVRKLKLLSTTSRTHIFRFDARENQLNSLLAIARLEQGSPTRKALLWFTDVTLFSTGQWSKPTDPPIPTYESVVEQLNASHVSVYPDLFNWRGFSSTDPSYYWYYAQQELAEATGGLSLTTDSISKAIEAVTADLGSYYMLTVTVPDPKKLDWVAVKIKVRRPGLTVRAPSGFLGSPQAKAVN